MLHTRTDRLLDSLDILILWSFAVAQPLFSILSRNAGFFSARGSRPGEILLLAAALSLGLPLILFLIEEIIGLTTASGRRLFHLLALAVLGEMLLLPWTKKVAGSAGLFLQWTLLLAVVLGTLTYARIRTARRSLAFLSPAVLIFPLIFLLTAPVNKLVFRREGVSSSDSPRIGNPVPVVMVVFDELPLPSLLNENLEINAFRYPNFATLAGNANWYRNATSVAEGTLNAVPSILTGCYPSPNLQRLPNSVDFPRSLFTLLGHQYNRHVREDNTRLCPESLCGEAAQKFSRYQLLRQVGSDLTVIYLHYLLPAAWSRRLPDMTNSWKEFVWKRRKEQKAGVQLGHYHDLMEWKDRPGEFTRFVDAIRPSSMPMLHYLHVLLPHAPWEYLPTGQRYTLDHDIRGVKGINDQGVDPNWWISDPSAVTQAYQRHLLQVGLVDHLLGYMVDHLKRTGLYDPALLIVIADHGCSFRMNDSRRRPTPQNYADILSVPLFIKLPFQTKGKIDDRNIEVTDLLPTLADLLQIDFQWKVDGQSVAGSGELGRNGKTFVTEEGERLTFPSALAALHSSVQAKMRLFGAGVQPEALYSTGPYTRLLGRSAPEMDSSGKTDAVMELDYPNHFISVDLKSSFLLTHITGHIRRPQANPFRPMVLGLAINGKIQAVTETFLDGDQEEFSAITPPWAYQSGFNKIKGFVASKLGQDLKLAPLDMMDEVARTYAWGNLIRFDAKGNSRPYLGEGWGSPESEYAWAQGKKAVLVLDTVSPGGPVILRAKVMAYVVPGGVDRQRVGINVNGRLIGQWDLRSPDVHEEVMEIPAECLAGSRPTVITLVTPDAISPASLGKGSDIRELSIGIFRLILSCRRGNLGT